MSHDDKTRPSPSRAQQRSLSRRVVLVSGGSALAYAGSLAVGLGCSVETGGGRATLSTRVKPVSKEPFTNAYHWTVRLQHAYLSIGSLTYFEGDALGFRRLFRALATPTAHAHPGHYQAGGVVAEMLDAQSVDLTSGITELGASRGILETARSARLTFAAPPAPPFARELDGAVVRVSGQAESGDTRVHFSSSIFATDLDAASERPDVEGCPFSNGALEETGVVTLSVDLELWFDQVDFADVAPGTSEEPTELVSDGRARRALVRGITKAAAYQLTFTAETT